MIKRIVVAVDDARESPPTRDCSLDCAGELARRAGAEISLLNVRSSHAVPPDLEAVTPYRLEGVVDHYGAVERQRDADTRAKLQVLEQRVEDAWSVAAGWQSEPVAPGEVPRAAREMGADLLVARLGQRYCAGGNLAELSEGILRSVGVPVLVLRAGTCPLLRGVTRLLVPLDGTPRSERILDAALPLLAEGAAVHLLAVVPTSPGAGRRGAPAWRSAAEAERYLAGVAGRPELSGVRVERHVVEGEATAELILDKARTLDVDLLAMTTARRGAIARRLFGSVTHEILEELDRPLLVEVA